MRSNGGWDGYWDWLTDVVKELSLAEIDEKDAEELAMEMRQLSEVQNLVESERIRRLARFDAINGAAQMGHPSSVAYLAFDLGLDPGAAAERVRLARQRDKLKATIAALAQGEITYDQAAITSNAAAMVDPSEAPKVEAIVLEAAKGGTVPARLRDFAKGVAETIDGDVLRRDAARAHRARYFTIGSDRDGIARLHGKADQELAALLRLMLEAELGPRHKGDRRTAGQRRHDGLKAGLRKALGGESRLPRRAGRVARVLFTGPEQTFKTGRGAPILLNNRTPVDIETVRRMTNGVRPRRLKSDVGTRGTARAFSAAQREAMEARNGYCDWPGGCGRPAEWSEGNHVIRFADGGATSVANGDVQCRFHNQLLEKGWRIVVGADGARGVLAPDHRDNPGQIAWLCQEAAREARGSRPEPGLFQEFDAGNLPPDWLGLEPGSPRRTRAG